MKAVIFDMDGVIIDSEPVHASVTMETLRQHGAKLSAGTNTLTRFAGMTIPVIFSALKEEHQIKASVEELVACHEAGLVKYVKETAEDPIQGILPLLKGLKEKNVPVAIASSSSKKMIELVVNKLKLTDYFQHLVSGEEVSRSKPYPDVYLATASRLGISPERCLVIEDSKNGTIAAKEAGMFCIGFRNPHTNGGKQDLSRADMVVDHITEIELDAWLG